jgi:hypothetical protein
MQAFQLHEFGDQLVFAGSWNLGFSAQFLKNIKIPLVWLSYCLKYMKRRQKGCYDTPKTEEKFSLIP